jgi:hypothetical protein
MGRFCNKNVLLTAQEQYEENPSPASQEEDQTNSRETSFEIINHINVDEMKCFSNDLKCKYSSPFEPGHAKSNSARAIRRESITSVAGGRSN